MDISTVVIIALAAALVAVLAHKALLSKFSDRYQAEAERVERERRRAERKSGPSRAGEGAAKIGRALPLSRAASDELRAKLVRAGIKSDPATWHGAEIISAVAFLLAGFLVGNAAGAGDAIAITACAACGLALGVMAPKLYVASRTRDRRAQIERELPDALDLLAISVRAGASIERAFKLVSVKTDGPLAEEFRQVDRDINLFNFRNTEALARMAQRCGSRHVGTFCSALIQSINQGSSIARVLQGQAKVARKIQFDRVEEQSNKTPTKLVSPMALAFVPATSAMGVAPQIASLLSLLGQVTM